MRENRGYSKVSRKGKARLPGVRRAFYVGQLRGSACPTWELEIFAGG